MSNEQTRRTFLKLSAVGLTATATADLASALSPALSPSPAAPPAGEITVRVTSGKLRYAPADSLTWRTAAKTPENANAIVLDPGRKYQQMLGFGAAFTDAACYMFNQLPAPAREELFHELFHPSEMGLSVCRTCIGSSDYSTEVFSYDEGDPDPEMKRFSIAHDQAYVLPMLRLARKANPDLFIFSSPWSPPGWMKAGGSMLGGSMRPRYFGPYAQYFVKFLQAYAAEGVPVQAVTVQNEVDTDQDARMPACSWPQEYEIGFVRDHLGPALQQNGLSTKIWVLDHNYNLWGRAICELDDAVCASTATRSPFTDTWARRKCWTRCTTRIPTRSCTGPKVVPTTRLPTMRPTGRIGGRPSRRQFDTGARRSADGIWRSMKKGSRTSGRFRAAGW